MTRQQRFKYEMFVRVRDFGVAHAALLREGSMGAQALARVAAAVAEIDEHLKDHVLGRSDARRVKTETRNAVYEYLKTLAEAARRVTRSEPGVSPFRLPRYRSLRAELATARAFLQEASDVRLSSKTVRRQALAGIKTALAQGLEAVRDLGVFVAIATRQDPTSFAAWTAARRIEGQRATAVKPPAEPAAVAPPADPAETHHELPRAS